VALVSAAVGDTILVHAREAIAVVGAQSERRHGIALPVPVLRHQRPVRRAGPGARVDRGQDGRDRRATPGRRPTGTGPGSPSARGKPRPGSARAGGLFAFGNGGSATDAQQLATLFLNPGDGAPPLPALGLANDTSVVTALCNDVGVEVVFAPAAGRVRRPERHRGRAVHQRQLGQPGPRLRRGEPARHADHRPGRLRRRHHGRAGQHRTYLFVVPSSSVHRIQEAQTTIYQVLWELTAEEVSHVPGHTR